MDEKTKKYLLYGGAAVVFLLLILFMRKSGSTSGGTTLYTTGISSSDAAGISIAGINASAAEQEAYYAEQSGIATAQAQLAFGEHSSDNAVTIANNANQADITKAGILGNIEADFIAAEQAVTLNTNKTAENIVANQGSTAVALQPSWESQLINGPGALNLQTQSGGFLQNASNNFVKFWNGGGFSKAFSFGGG